MAISSGQQPEVSDHSSPGNSNLSVTKIMALREYWDAFLVMHCKKWGAGTLLEKRRKIYGGTKIIAIQIQINFVTSTGLE